MTRWSWPPCIFLSKKVRRNCFAGWNWASLYRGRKVAFHSHYCTRHVKLARVHSRSHIVVDARLVGEMRNKSLITAHSKAHCWIWKSFGYLHRGGGGAIFFIFCLMREYSIQRFMASSLVEDVIKPGLAANSRSLLLVSETITPYAHGCR